MAKQKKKQEKNEQNTKNKGDLVKKTLLAVSIAIVFVFFVVFGIETFYDKPEYKEFCDNIEPLFCEEDKKCEPNPEYKVCQNEFDSEKEKFNLIVFIVMISVGLLVMILSFFTTSDVVSSGLMGGGSLSVIVGTFRNWSNFHDWMRFIILGLTLIVLIWIGYKKLKI